VKLRFHRNSIRFRLNQIEVAQLACGSTLEEEVWFPTAELPFRYILALHDLEASARLEQSPPEIRVLLKRADVKAWAVSDELELHLSLPTCREPLTLMIEKDLVCLDAPAEERDPHAFPRAENPVCK
jgi:hypothetical protein